MWPSIPGKIYLRRQATDMRNSFNGLCGLVRLAFDQEPDDGSLFVFVNRRRDMLKALWWDRDGFALWCKRLERGTFSFAAEGKNEISNAELALLLEGVTANIVRYGKRWHKSDKSP